MHICRNSFILFLQSWTAKGTADILAVYRKNTRRRESKMERVGYISNSLLNNQNYIYNISEIVNFVVVLNTNDFQLKRDLCKHQIQISSIKFLNQVSRKRHDQLSQLENLHNYLIQMLKLR